MTQTVTTENAPGKRFDQVVPELYQTSGGPSTRNYRISFSRHIFHDYDLDLVDCALHGLIDGLSDERGYCYASNAYLANELKLKIRRTQLGIERLVEVGLVERHFVNGERRLIPSKMARKAMHSRAPHAQPCIPPMHDGAPPPCTTMHPYIKDYKKEDPSLSNACVREGDMPLGEVLPEELPEPAVESPPKPTPKQATLLDPHAYLDTHEPFVALPEPLQAQFRAWIASSQEAGRGRWTLGATQLDAILVAYPDQRRLYRILKLATLNGWKGLHHADAALSEADAKKARASKPTAQQPARKQRKTALEVLDEMRAAEAYDVTTEVA